MFRWTKKEQIGYKMINGVKKALYHYTGACLSSDTKPTGGDIANGSEAIEMDTSKVCFYDEAGELWREF